MNAQDALVTEAISALNWAARGEFSASIKPRHAQALLLERSIDKTTLQTQDAAIERLKERGGIDLDVYEIANLRAGLEVLRALGLDTGDWLGQILAFKLPEVEREPNVLVTLQLHRVRARLAGGE